MRNQLKTAVLAFALAAPLMSSCVFHANDGAKTSTPPVSQESGRNWSNVPTQTITAGGVNFAYRELGKSNGGTPVVFLVHLAAVLDNWDPRIVDGIAAKHHVIAFDNRGIGASSGSAVEFDGANGETMPSPSSKPWDSSRSTCWGFRWVE